MSDIITIAICTYNNSRLLRKALDTLEQQKTSTSITWSALVVDNNSSDDTAELIQHYIARATIPGLRYVCENKQGIAHARRRAALEISSELIGYVDDDCLLSPDWVENAVSFCLAHPKAGAVGSQVHLLWEVSPDELCLKNKLALAHQDHGEEPVQLPSKGWTYLVTTGLVLRRHALFESGWIKHGKLVGREGTKRSAGEDGEMVLLIRNAGYELWYNSAMQLQHFIPRRRMTVEYFCQLARGFGVCSPYLESMAESKTPTLRWRFHILTQSLKAFIKFILKILLRDLLPHRQVSSDRRIEFQVHKGRLEGSIQFFLRGC